MSDVLDPGLAEPVPTVQLPAAAAYDELIGNGRAGTASEADLSLVFDLPVELAGRDRPHDDDDPRDARDRAPAR